jgi:two-component system, chemotaxis family, protein-glutamate methylesterase/glutaminase
MIRIVVAEDSVTARQLLVEMLESDPDLRVVGQAANGIEAIRLAERLEPDLIVMDVFMPQLDGLQATKEIMIRSPRPIIVVSSADSIEGVGLSLSATRAGALLALPKPDGPRSPRFEQQRRELVAMARAMAAVRVVRRWSRPSAVREPSRQRTPWHVRPRVVTMAASTGGPAAVHRILLELPRDYPVPVLVVQHIAQGFVDGFVEWLGRGYALRVKTAEHGEPVLRHTVYVAPDDRHLGLSGDGRIRLSDDPPIRGFRPSATYLFDSASAVWGRAVLAVLLTGMGTDGVDGLARVHAAGGRILAQDESSSIVFGMAAEAARVDLVDELLPLDGIASRLRELAGAGGPRDDASPPPPESDASSSVDASHDAN